MGNYLVIKVSDSGKRLIGNREFTVNVNQEKYFLNKSNPKIETALHDEFNELVFCENEYCERITIENKGNEVYTLTVNPSIKKLELILISIFSILAISFILFTLNNVNLIAPRITLAMIPLISLYIYFMNYKNQKETFVVTKKKQTKHYEGLVTN